MNKFKRVFDRNRRYTMATVYSEAYRFMSYHYDAFIEILIIIQTMVDMISEVQEYIINKDVFDSRTIRYLFESYGIAYYKEIPVKYQIRIIKNVNTLLKYKSSHRNIIDILELFDDDTITIYTYYLMKTKKLHRDNFFFYTEDDVNPKYGTERDYWIGPKSDISNNKVLSILQGGSLASINYKSKLVAFDNNINKYKEIIIGSPIWNGRLSCPINSVLNKLEIKDKKITFILYSGSGKSPKATDKLKKIYPKCNIIDIKEPKNNNLDKYLKNI